MQNDGLQLVALVPHLPAAGQLALANLRHPWATRAQAALASRTDLTSAAARTLVGHLNPTVRRRALACTSDRNLLANVRSGSTRDLAAVAQNRHSDPAQLAALVHHTSDEVVLRAVCNPATPQKARRAALSSPERAEHLVKRKSPLGAQVVRAGELAAVNSWLLEHAHAQKPAILRGLLTLPDCNAELLTAAGAGRWPSSALHPGRWGEQPSQMDSDTLAEHPSGAAHLELLSRSECTAAQAGRILLGHELRSGRKVDPEPHVLARIVRRFGSQPFAAVDTAAALLAGTRIEAAGWADAQAGELLAMFTSYGRSSVHGPRDLGAAQQVTDILLDDSDAWAVFYHLAANTFTGASQLMCAAEAAAAV